MTRVTADSTASTAHATRTAGGGAPGVPAPAPGSRRRSGRRSVRAAAVAVGLVGALALTACSDGGSDGGSGGGGDESSAAPGASASAETGGSGGGSPSAGAAGELEGSWLATSDGQAVALMVTGDKAALFATGGTVCSGTAAEASGTRTIRLKCTGGDDRTTGTVESVDDTSLKVTWEGGVGEETYTRSEGGSMPPGLPTEGLGS
ncbi:hypothetical protein ACI3K5_11810 [Streptomyces sp. MPA0124]|uniref:hypothetical protein n=1 Tax=unclassified Streptomyces TaxID=2593676 RepID=UPI000A9D37F2|nr:hypothetical protein [Streptomyces sp. CCM_MD2014]